MVKLLLNIVLLTFFSLLTLDNSHAQRQMEKLNRGLVAVRSNSNQVFVSWRLLGTDDSTTVFNLSK